MLLVMLNFFFLFLDNDATNFISYKIAFIHFFSVTNPIVIFIVIFTQHDFQQTHEKFSEKLINNFDKI